MRKIIILLLVMLPIFTFAQKEWLALDASTEQLKISFFAEPNVVYDTVDIGDGMQATVIAWDVEIDDASHPNVLYSLGVTKFPASFLHSDSSFEAIEPLLESAASPIMESEYFEHLSGKYQMKDGYPGKNYKFKVLGSEGMLEMQVFLVENQLIQLSIITRPENWFNITY